MRLVDDIMIFQVFKTYLEKTDAFNVNKMLFLLIVLSLTFEYYLVVWTKRGMHDKTSRNIADEDGNDTLHLVAHPVNFLYIGKDHFRVNSVISHHSVHVFCC